MSKAWMQVVRGLEAYYTTGGRGALTSMTPVEVYVLAEEKSAALHAANAILLEHPGQERWQLRREQLKAEVGDIETWLKEHVAPFHETQTVQRQALGAEKNTGNDRGLER